jgi:hypothetical protein
MPRKKAPKKTLVELIDEVNKTAPANGQIACRVWINRRPQEHVYYGANCRVVHLAVEKQYPSPNKIQVWKKDTEHLFPGPTGKPKDKKSKTPKTTVPADPTMVMATPVPAAKTRHKRKGITLVKSTKQELDDVTAAAFDAAKNPA